MIRSVSRWSSTNPSEHQCRFCGRPATQFLFAEFICDDEECVNKAREVRGGPAGHMLEKKEHSCAKFGEMDFDG